MEINIENLIKSQIEEMDLVNLVKDECDKLINIKMKEITEALLNGLTK